MLSLMNSMFLFLHKRNMELEGNSQQLTEQQAEQHVKQQVKQLVEHPI
jgi:hypothetical protein